ncbi:MAG: hypothetical protein EA401_04520 [Planctomycetota bacterium]|nr:MAG: hypothetical protein EA401_04520 [Planctomycetota bacterium]
MITYFFPRVLLFLAICAAVLGGVVFIVQMAAEQSLGGMPAVLSPLLLGFGLFKGALAFNARAVLNHGGPPAATLIARHGTAGNVRQWIVYKFTAMGMALFAAFVIGVYVFV